MLRTHLGLKIAFRNKSESLDIQREKLSALPPALLPLNTAALRFEFQQWKKSWKLQSKSADGIQMLIHILFEFAAIYNFYFERKTVTGDVWILTYIAWTFVFYAFVCVCDQKISYDFRNTHSAALWLHSMNTHPKKVFIDRNKAKKCSLQINLCIQQKATHMKTVTNFTFPDSQTKTRFSCKFSGIWVSSPEKN